MSTAAHVMIEMSNINKSYGRIQALNDVSFQVHEGEVLGLLGPNGAGKTTIMKILTCYTPPSSGSFKIGGIDGFDQPQKARSLIGYMPENNPLYLEMTVQGFLKFIGRTRSLSGSELQNRMEQVIEQCGLEKVRRRIIRHLSKGYRQRVGLAQAIIANPSILILDEPTIGLDPGQVVEMRERIKDMAGNRTVIFSSHILHEVSQVCDRVVIINHGQIVAQDPPRTLIQQLANSIDVDLEIKGETQKVLSVLRGVPGVRTAARGNTQRRYRVEVDQDEDIRVAISHAMASNGLGMLEMRVNELNLEDIFLHIIAHEQGGKTSS